MNDVSERFLSGWRYITTREEADELPRETVAITDDHWTWDPADPIIAVKQRDLVIDDYDEGLTHQPWIEPNDNAESECPELPFFAWHPAFCIPASVGTTEPRQEGE